MNEKNKFEELLKLQYGDKSEIEHSDWTISKLNEICKFEYGDHLPERERNEEGEIPVFGSASKVGTHTEPYVDTCGIITARKGSIGEVSYSEEPFYPIDTTYYIGKKETDENLRWLYYALDLLDLNRVNASTAIPSLNRDDAGVLNVPVPPLSEQRRIASVLYSVDEQVRSLHDRHDELTQLKHGLMQDLLTGNKRVTPETPVRDEVSSGVGSVEEQEWESAKIKDVVETIQAGYAFKSDEFGESGVPVIKSENYTALNTIGLNSEFEKIDGTTLEELKDRYFIESEMVIISMVGANSGSVGYSWGNKKFALNQNQWYLDSKDKILNSYLYYYLDGSFNKLQSILRGGGKDFLGRSEFKAFNLNLPPLWEQERIASVLYTVDEMIARTSELIDEYDRLKRGLMQDLLSGGIRTPEDLEVLDEIQI